MVKEVIRVVAAVIDHDGRYLITQRNSNAVLPGLWEFPGGRVEPDESETACLLREVKGRIGVEVIVGAKLGEHQHDYTTYQVHLTMYSCKLPPRRGRIRHGRRPPVGHLARVPRL